MLLAAHFLRSAQWAIAAVFLIGFAKECWDSRFDSDFCFFDIFANIMDNSAALLFTLALPTTLFA